MTKNISRFQYLTQPVPNATATQLTEQICTAGARWIQLRMKNTLRADFLNAAMMCRKICDAFNAQLIINDDVQIALECAANGVHVGSDDMAVKKIRMMVDNDFIIGKSCHTLDDILHAIDDGADYAGIGPFRFTNTKENLNPVLNLKGIEKITHELAKRKIQFPLIAIGGIQIADVKSILKTGAYGVAVSSAINLNANRALAVNEFLKFFPEQDMQTIKSMEVL